MESCGGELLASSAGSIATEMEAKSGGGDDVQQSPAWGRLEEKARAREWQVGALIRSCWKQASSTT